MSNKKPTVRVGLSSGDAAIESRSYKSNKLSPTCLGYYCSI